MNMTNQQLWQAVLGELELILSRPNFTTWFKNTFISSFENDRVIICVPNDFTKNWLEEKYHNSIIKALENVTQIKIKETIYKVETMKIIPKNDYFKKNAQEEIDQEKNKNLKIGGSIQEFNLNPRYTFENFIVGKGSELAHAACQATVNHLGTKYNPLFIYGGVGLGKTHLLQAVGHATIGNYENKKVLYITCEKFINDFIQGIKYGTMKKFKETYRNADLLLIDDIQFIAGKETTQEQFFHTFNELHQNNKQIVITSDRLPKAIPTLEQRLLSRFEWGMIVDVSQPDLETRIAILEHKCREQKFTLEKEVVNYIATNIQSNIRELEGVLNKIIAHYEFHKINPNLETVKNLLIPNTLRPRQGSITTRQLIEVVSSFYEIKIDDLLGKIRTQKLAMPRQVIMYLMRKELKRSFPTIGDEVGGRDHTTAIHAYDKISREIQENERIRRDIELIIERLYN